MLHQAPRHLPSLSLILADLGRPSPQAVGEMLGTSPAAVRRWIRADLAPRPAMLALFWCTRWGRSIVDAQAVNDARLYAGLAECYRTESASRLAQLKRLLELGQFACANDVMQA